MHQRIHANEILNIFKMEDYIATSTPAEPIMQLSKNLDEDYVGPTQYKRLIGSLRYLCDTRSDLACNVGMVSRFMKKAKVSYLEATKRILRYL